MKSTTIRDVAKEAGVSFKTVSRVLNNEGDVTDATKEIVQAAIAKLNYKPNVAARALSGSRSYVIGLLFSNPPGAAFHGVIQAGAADACRAANYHLLIEWLEGSAGTATAKKLGQLLDTVKLDGMLLTAQLCFSPEIMSELERRQIPYVRIAPAGELGRSSYAKIDEKRASYEMTKSLLLLGHRKIGFIKGREGHGNTKDRFDGFKMAMDEARISVNPKWIDSGNWRFADTLDVARTMIADKDRPTAIFASNDHMALAVMSMARQLGLDIPGELSVTGFDDLPSAEMVWPQLTTVRFPLTEMARQATDLLLAPETRNIVRGLVLPYELIVRGSTAPPPND